MAHEALGWVVPVPFQQDPIELDRLLRQGIPVRYDQFVQQLFKPLSEPMMKLHAALGVCTEAGELGDNIKAEVIYGKPINRLNVVEELSDLRFFIQAVMMLYDISEQEVLQHNASKLATRYEGLRYSDIQAIERKDKQ